MVEKRSPRLLQRETVYRWFSELPSPQRVEFLCGLLDLCIPLELRFLGACLEDLARKDYHSLRDSEIKANNPADLGSLTNLTDEVVRSKLLVSLALLGSSHREAAGVLFRTLTHIDSVIHNYGLQLNEGRTGDEFLLLFTMAANHPAFSFHQKQVLRQELTKIQNIMASTSKSPPGMPPDAAASHMAPCPGCHKVTSRSETSVHGVGNSLENALHTSAHSMEELLPKRPSGKHSKVSVEKVELKGISPKRNERTIEYAFEVLWSDSSVTSVTKSCVEVTEFISKLGQLYPEENLEKTIPCLAGPDSFYLERNHIDLESDLRYLASFPPHIWKNDHVKKFFSTSSHLQLFQNSSPANASLYKVGPSLAASGRPVCGVAGIPSSQNNPQHRSPPSASASSAVLLSHCTHPGVAGSALSCRSQLENSLPVLLATASQAQEQNGILEWLRKLRLHKYYPVFKELTMEKFLSLTEDDLNKFESLTMGAKKKLKTQLELEKEKSEKRAVNPADSSDSSSSSSVSAGVARVPPTTHVAPIQGLRSAHATDLRVEVDQSAPPNPPREGSSSEYSGSGSSSSSSPMGIQTPREESSDSAEESERRLEIPLESPEKEKQLVPILSHFSPASARPTAQVLPSVQNEAGSGGPSTHHSPVPVQLGAAATATGSSHVIPMRILNAMHKSERGTPELRLLSSSSSSMQSLLTLEERAKYSPPGGPPRSSLKMEKSFGGPVPEGPVLASHQATPNHHHPAAVAAAATAPAAVVNFGPRTKMAHASTLDRMAKTQAQPGGMVEPSPTTAATSSALFHMARPPIKLLVSSSLPTDATLGGPSPGSNNMQFSLPPALISPRTALYSANTKVAFSALSGGSSSSSSLPVGSPMPSGSGGFCANGNAASPTTTTTTPFANLNHGPPCPAPSQSPPTLSPATENSFYPSGTNQNHYHHHHHHHHPQQQPSQPPGCLVCSSCGCSGNCGSGGVTVSYGNFFQPAFSGPSVLTFPFLPFNPLCGGNGYLNTQQYNGGGGTAFPMVHSPYNQSAAMAPDSLLSGQSAFAVPPMQSFLAGTAGVYQASAMLGGGSGGHKKNGNLSCYNCGASGHRAQDCKQPPMDFNRQGTFRLKYAPPAESLDSTD